MKRYDYDKQHTPAAVAAGVCSRPSGKGERRERCRRKLEVLLVGLCDWLESFHADDEVWMDEVVETLEQIEGEGSPEEAKPRDGEPLLKKALAYGIGTCALAAVCLCAGLFTILVMLSIVPVIVRRLLQRGAKSAVRKLRESKPN